MDIKLYEKITGLHGVSGRESEVGKFCKDELKKYPLILQKRPSNNREYFEQVCLENNIEKFYLNLPKVARKVDFEEIESEKHVN